MWRGCPGGGGLRGWHGGGRRDGTGDKEGSPGPGPRRRRRGQGHSRNGLPARDRGAALTHLQAPAGGEGVPHRDPRPPQAMLRPQPQLAALWPQCGEWPPGGTRASEMPGQPKEEEGALGREGRVRGRALPRRRRGGGSGSGQEPWAAWPSAGRGLREVCDMGPSVNVTSAAWAGRWSGGVPMGSEARPDKKPLGAPPQGHHGVTGPGSLWPCAQLQVTSSQGSVRHVCEGGPPRPPWPSAAPAGSVPLHHRPSSPQGPRLSCTRP